MTLKMLSLKNYRLSANSILESVIALSIITSILMISVNIITILYNSEKSILYFQTTQKIKELQWDVIQNKTLQNKTYSFKTISIKKEINQFNNKQLLEVEYSFELEGKEYLTTFYVTNE